MKLLSWVRRALGLGAGLGIGLLAACVDKGGAAALELTTHDKMEAGIVALWKGGGSAALASLTDFDWDTVVIYPEGAPASQVHAAVGQPVLGDQRYFTNARNLFVFRHQGRVVRLVLNGAAVFANDDYGRAFGRSLVLTSSAPGTGVLTLTQP